MMERRLKLIDFDDPSNPKKNRFLVVRELWVQGRLWRRRPDVICYVNGLPLIFIELKRYDQHIDKAYKKNYSDYLDTIPHLFHWNALVLLSNGVDAKYGSLTSTKEYFSRWKRCQEEMGQNYFIGSVSNFGQRVLWAMPWICCHLSGISDYATV